MTFEFFQFGAFEAPEPGAAVTAGSGDALTIRAESGIPYRPLVPLQDHEHGSITAPESGGAVVACGDNQVAVGAEADTLNRG